MPSLRAAVVALAVVVSAVIASVLAAMPGRAAAPYDFDFDEEDLWWYHPLPAVLPLPPAQVRIPYDPADNYVHELSHFMGLAVSTIRDRNPHVKVTTNFGRFPFDESAITDGRRYFGELPKLDITSVTIYPDYDPVVLDRIPQIVTEFRQLGKPVEIAEIGVCTSRHTLDQ
jgi:hypothetical protein